MGLRRFEFLENTFINSFLSLLVSEKRDLTRFVNDKGRFGIGFCTLLH